MTDMKEMFGTMLTIYITPLEFDPVSMLVTTDMMLRVEEVMLKQKKRFEQYESKFEGFRIDLDELFTRFDEDTWKNIQEELVYINDELMRIAVKEDLLYLSHIGGTAVISGPPKKED